MPRGRITSLPLAAVSQTAFPDAILPVFERATVSGNRGKSKGAGKAGEQGKRGRKMAKQKRKIALFRLGPFAKIGRKSSSGAAFVRVRGH
jgi:hypothetical protein